jgi:hypothetical protein
VTRHRLLAGLTVLAAVVPLLLSRPASLPADHGAQQGQGVVIELDNKFIKDYENRATITSSYTLTGISAVHPPAKDGEVHAGGWAYAAGMPCVAEVMNAASSGAKDVKALRKALSDDRKVTVAGAWRLWGEHPGTAPQVQSLKTDPTFPLPGEYPSNPDHVFEIHPVTSLKVGDGPVDASAAKAIGPTAGHTPYDPQKAMVQGYETLTCTIVPKGDRTRIITQSLGFNFTEFVIRLGEDPVQLDDGHAAICSVFDTDGELLIRGRRMVFLKGTDADDRFQASKKGERLHVIGIPRISLKLVQWRLDHSKDKDADGNPKYDTSPLGWRLPYEMIIVSATPLEGEGD